MNPQSHLCSMPSSFFKQHLKGKKSGHKLNIWKIAKALIEKLVQTPKHNLLKIFKKLNLLSLLPTYKNFWFVFYTFCCFCLILITIEQKNKMLYLQKIHNQNNKLISRRKKIKAKQAAYNVITRGNKTSFDCM